MTLRNKTVLILGGTGSLGNAMTERLVEENKIVIFSRGETAQWKMRQKFEKHLKNLTFVIGDIRDENALKRVIFTYRPQIVLIAAAMKHIDICEEQISECLKTNIEGVGLVIEFIVLQKEMNQLDFMECLVFVSTDKACSPVNIYGKCKSISEGRMVNNSRRVANTSLKLVTVRYGNVLSSNGSILQKYNLIARDPKFQYFGVTDEEMTRFFMSLEESVTLILNSILYGENGDICIPKIPSYRILEIANYYSEKYQKPVKMIGIRPGEKIHECLINETESLRLEERDHFYAITPVINPQNKLKSYSSADHIRSVIDENGVYVFTSYL